jgi:hypothetical protein
MDKIATLANDPNSIDNGTPPLFPDNTHEGIGIIRNGQYQAVWLACKNRIEGQEKGGICRLGILSNIFAKIASEGKVTPAYNRVPKHTTLNPIP